MAEDKRLHCEKKKKKPVLLKMEVDEIGSLSDEESDDDFEDEEGGKSDNSPPESMTGGSRRACKKRQVNSSGNPVLEKGSYRDPVCVSCLGSVLHSSSWAKASQEFDAFRNDQKAELKKFSGVKPKAITACAPDTRIPVFGALSPPLSSTLVQSGIHSI
ncbi:hypothetical protein LY76DRAFT_633081 [Colletotrichum caudatum]|nr:hypothetical protein LY76DRAFT_633081 [Colletotrichum caudatum]